MSSANVVYIDLPPDKNGFRGQLQVFLDGGWHRGDAEDPLIRIRLFRASVVKSEIVLPLSTLFNLFPLLRAALLVRGFDA